MIATTPYNPVDYLTTPELIAAYLNEAATAERAMDNIRRHDGW
jgi:hypothetical protein